MKKYARLTCSECKRTLDQLVNMSHYVPNRCNITLGCEGSLKIEGYTNNGDTIRNTPDIGVSNWLPRGYSFTNNASSLKDDVLVNLSTGSYQQVILAIKDPGISIDSQSTVILQFTVENSSPKDFRKYTFRKNVAIKILNGIEDSPEKKALRYNITGENPDIVEVYVNGIKKNLGTGSGEFQLYDESITSAVPPNSIVFNENITGGSQIDVVVSKSQPTSNINLTFRRMVYDNSRVSSGTWEGVDYVTKIDSVTSKWFLFYCDISEQEILPLNSKLRITDTQLPVFTDGITKLLQLKDCAFLLSNDGLYTYLDQIKSKYIPLSGLNDVTKYLTIKLDDNIKNVYCTEDSVEDVFPLLIVKNYFAKKPISTNMLFGNSESTKVDSQIILGPDA